jgi:hypothetical protein
MNFNLLVVRQIVFRYSPCAIDLRIQRKHMQINRMKDLSVNIAGSDLMKFAPNKDVLELNVGVKS